MMGFLKTNASGSCEYLSAIHTGNVCFGSLHLPAVPLPRITGKAGEAALQR